MVLGLGVACENQVGNGGKEVVLVGRGGFLLVPGNNRAGNGINGLPRGAKHIFDNEGLGKVEKLGHSGVEG